MRLYIMRHGEAVQAGADAIRPLTPKGRADAVKVAKFLLDSGSPVDAIWHSTKARAIETATFIDRTFGQRVPLETRSDLNPDDSVEKFFDNLQEEGPENLLIVGHIPFVESLISFFVTGGECSPVAFKTATLVALEGTFETGFSILWAVNPDCLP
jgi:phosphohistidine phosphatase